MKNKNHISILQKVGIFLLPLVFSIFLFSLLSSCGSKGGTFTLSGKFLHLNQGEFYVYSPDNVIEGIDTIQLIGGKISYEIPCDQEGTLMIIFPNFSEHPIFAKPGKKVKISADASHLKEMKVTGTKENELMNDFREQTAEDAPPQLQEHAKQFIIEHSQSIVSIYLVRKYFLQATIPDYSTADSLISIMLKEQPKNGILNKMKQYSSSLKNVEKNKKLPAVKAKTIYGKVVSSAELNDAPHAVIYTWVTWNFESLDLQRQLRAAQKKSNGKLKIMGICLDAGKYECKQVLKRDSISWPVIYDGEMFEGYAFRKLGLTTIPDNIILEKGKVVARGLQTKDILDRIK